MRTKISKLTRLEGITFYPTSLKSRMARDENSFSGSMKNDGRTEAFIVL